LNATSSYQHLPRCSPRPGGEPREFGFEGGDAKAQEHPVLARLGFRDPLDGYLNLLLVRPAQVSVAHAGGALFAVFVPTSALNSCARSVRI